MRVFRARKKKKRKNRRAFLLGGLLRKVVCEQSCIHHLAFGGDDHGVWVGARDHLQPEGAVGVAHELNHGRKHVGAPKLVHGDPRELDALVFGHERVLAQPSAHLLLGLMQ